METVFSADVINSLNAARRPSVQRRARWRAEAAGRSFEVLRMWETGFAMRAQGAPELRGLVDLYDGAVHLGLCFVTEQNTGDSVVTYAFKKAAPFAKPAGDDTAVPAIVIDDGLSDFQ